jgi:dipeptidyl aminopeptidase/acylaminoacyl peptidase
VYWLEGRPAEGGRHAIVRRAADGDVRDVTPSDFNARTRVHEYGGGSFVVAAGRVYASSFGDQRIYRVDAAGRVDGAPRAITPAGPWRYADATVDAGRDRLIAVREDHAGGAEPVNTLVAVSLAGAVTAGQVLAAGHDFYATPRLAPDGRRLAWLAWRHPQMPWDGTELWVAEVETSGALGGARCVAGGPAESIYQPGWLPDGSLCFASDRDGWWRLYRTADPGVDPAVPLVAAPPPDAEFGRPQWIFGTATWAPAGPGRLVVSYTRAGRWRLAVVHVGDGTLTHVATEVEPREWLASSHTHAVLVAGFTSEADAVVRVALDTGHAETLRRASAIDLDVGSIAVPEAVSFASADGARAHAFYYPPRNAACEGPAGERPPLVVMSHGGPTDCADPGLSLKIQFWTTRGFAVADVNYGGSSGFGRAYRERLNAAWGLVDVADVVAAVQHLVAEGRADPRRVAIRGGSAGGYTTLAALAFAPGVFAAGASYYGVSDLDALARDTHKFESRYLDTLVGPYPAERDLYRRRSPLHAAARIACPVILFQGLEDAVVPPNQSEGMAAAVRARGLPVAYLAFEGEQHGFRRAETITRCLEAELFFYGVVFGFEPADKIEPVSIDNLPLTSRRQP